MASDLNKPAKNKGGRPPNVPKVSTEDLAKLVLLPDMGRKRLSDATGLGEDANRLMQKVTAATIEEFKEIQHKELREAMELAVAQTKTALPDASAYQAATVYGIFWDKLFKNPQVNQTLHIHLASGDRAGAINALLGKHSERVSPAKDVTPIAPDAAGPVVDLAPDAPEPGPILRTGDSQSPVKPRK